MGFFQRLTGRLAGGPNTHDSRGRGLFVFENTSEVIAAERALVRAGRTVRVMGPPPEIRTGCDLVIEFDLVEQMALHRILDEAGLAPLSAVPVTSPLLAPVDLFQVTDFGGHLMVRAANMKLTVDKNTGVIVNVSGGGCPDVPYLGARLVGQNLWEAPTPRELGHTLCGYALHLAYEKMRTLCSE